MKNKYISPTLAVIAGAIIWRWMMRTPLDEHSASASVIVMWLSLLFLMRYVYKTYGKTQLTWIACIALFGICIEYIGIRTCVPYGCFTYTDLVWTRFFWTFPLSLLAIRPILVVSIIQLIPWKKYLLRPLIAWIGLMLFDLVLDPVAVKQWLRIYTSETIYTRYNVPWTNFLWRIFTGSVSTRMIKQRSPKIIWDKYLTLIGWFFLSMYIMAFAVVAGYVGIV